MGTRIAFVGAGAVGAYVGGMIARAGEEVTLIDAWPQNIQAIKTSGLHLSGTQVEHVVHVNALHIHEVQGLLKSPIDIAFICTKSYDTAWATALIKDYLSRAGFVVSLQNGINEEVIASVVGWTRTVGAIVDSIGVNLHEAGHVRRDIGTGGSAHDVFRVGEPHGQVSRRVDEVVRLLSHVDSCKATTNLWGERWTKLILNSMINPVAAISGFSLKETLTTPKARRISIALGAEAIAVGEAHGVHIEDIWGIPAARWRATLNGASTEDQENALLRTASRTTDAALPSAAQDIRKGRRTEIESFNGLVTRKADEVGVDCPTNKIIIGIMREIERGVLSPAPANLDRCE